MSAEIYTWSTCPFCIRATQLLEQRGITYTEHVMDDRPEELGRLKSRYGHPTVPIILLDDEFIGGYDELRALDASGRLVTS